MPRKQASTDRVALVTGAARGIGRATALRLLRDGFAVAVIDINPETLASLEPIAKEHPNAFHYEEASVTDSSAVERVMKGIVERWGKLDVLVNNAGLNRPTSTFAYKESDWDLVVATNMKGTFLCSAAAAPIMREHKGGSIVNIGSIAAAGLGGGTLAYTASKAGLIGLTKAMASELGPHGIRVNLVAPGVTKTEWVEKNLPDAMKETTVQSTPLRRIAEPDDIAGTVAFLASDDARHITGQVISVSGGAWMP